MTFDEWLEEIFKSYKDEPAYGLNMEALRTGNLRKAWDAGVESCAGFLDKDADKMEKVWNDYIASGGEGPATSYHTIPREYAKKIRVLIKK